MLSVAIGATWLLAVALVPMAIVAVSVVPICSTMPVVWARSVASMSLATSTASTVASMATVSSHDIHAQIEAVAAVRIGPRVRMAVMTVRTNDALYPLVGLLGRLAVVWSVTSCSGGPSSQTEAVDAVMEPTDRSMRREDVSLAPANLRGRQAAGVATALWQILVLLTS